MKKNILLLMLCVVSISALAQYRVEKVMEGLRVPWSISFINETKVLVTERNGKILIVDLENNTKQDLLKISDVAAQGQGGLLDIALSPYDRQTFYFTYSKKTSSGADTTLAIATFNENKVTQWNDLLVTVSNSDTSRHFGSRIVFIDKHVFFTVGDRGIRPNGQDLSTHAGSVLRLNIDGTVPHDNPFVKVKNARPEIWSFGHRNPQGLYFDQQTQDLWEIEHGPRGGDEINLIKKGANYGWAKTSYGKEYWGPLDVGESKEAEGVESPSKVYIPSIAPSGLLLYRGNRYPDFNGKLLTGALKLTHINVITMDENHSAVKEERILEDLQERIRDIKLSPDGWIYFTTDNGNIYRLQPNK
ncbi:PQQ-dependent sugar dehydrogenase [Vibrio ziniensis]|uniref:PQQ-dependent sugar dehydrogenase n=1 Tax=Vibrio ziniensis TaxID=2711221 RepID=A0A6G7CHP0_9VIBR|nr:PQQ-dependent sugar dehydrogenase [Vibrio ziniensis]QIH41556.1 PQQ-dependent sugar dehydrogenase [Vibrio ziniensis]